MNKVEAKKGFKTFLLLTGALGLSFGAVRGFSQGGYLPIKAGSAPQVKNLQISNLTAQTVTISWETEEEDQGLVTYGTDPNNLNRTAPEAAAIYRHQITIENLAPQTTYYYKVGLDGESTKGAPYQFTTLPEE